MQNKKFQLLFNNAKIYATEKERHNIISNGTCLVKKHYDEEKLAIVKVNCEDIVLFLPHDYHLGVGIFKAMNHGNLLIKWTISLLISK